MKGLIITSKGIEDTACIEVKEIINTNCKAEQGCALFEFNDIKDICLLCYKSQTASRVLILINNFRFENFFEEFEKSIDNSKLGEWVHDKMQFKVECMRIGTHEFKSTDVEAKAGQIIINNSKKRDVKVNIKDYETIFFVYIFDNKCYFGVDFAGFELNKRNYKIFLHPNSLRGPIAYSLIRDSGFQKKERMLDPFSRDGVTAIESALYAADFPVNYYNKEKFAFLKLKLGIDFGKMFKSCDTKIKKTKLHIYNYDHLFKYVDYSKKNAKIAGVDKQVTFSRVELEWLDIKFKEGSLDRIISNPPTPKDNSLDKIYNEFFYQSAYILKKGGTLAFISKTPGFVKRHAERPNLALLKEKEVWSSQQLLTILVFEN